MKDVGLSFAGAQWNRWESALILYAGYLMHLDPEPSTAKQARGVALIEAMNGAKDEASFRRILRDVAGVTAEEIIEPIKLALAARGTG